MCPGCFLFRLPFATLPSVPATGSARHMPSLRPATLRFRPVTLAHPLRAEAFPKVFVEVAHCDKRPLEFLINRLTCVVDRTCQPDYAALTSMEIPFRVDPVLRPRTPLRLPGTVYLDQGPVIRSTSI